jgi:hypothetical protein
MYGASNRNLTDGLVGCAMIRTSFFLLALVALTGFCSGQRITMKKTVGGVSFETDTLILSSRQVLEILENEPLPHEEFRRARRSYAAASILGFTGGLMIALPVVSAVVGSAPQWGWAAGGALLILTSIPLVKEFTLHAQRALDAHNKQFSTRVISNVYFSGTGLRLTLRF